MRTLDVVPLYGAGPLQLGMSRTRSRLQLGVQHEELKKSVYSSKICDGYFKATIHVHFDEDDRVEFIELWRGGPFAANVGGIDVLGATALEVLASLRESGLVLDERERNTLFIGRTTELALWRNDDTDPCFESVSVAVAGYHAR